MQLTDKPALVFLHYFGGSALSWQWVTEKLTASHHCIVPDLPGFGGAMPLQNPSVQEMARWVLDHVKKHSIEKYTLIGHSMGGKIAVQAAALDTNGSIEQLFLIAPSPPTVEPIPEAEKKQMLRHPDRQQAEASVKKNTIRPLTQEQHNLAIATQLIADPDTWRWWINVGTSHSIQDQVTAIKIPVTVLASEDDPAISFDLIQREVMGVLPGAKLMTIKKVGHLSPMEAPEWIAGHLSEK